MNTCRIYHVLVLGVISLAGFSVSAQDAADRDYSEELKRIPPTEPADALKTFEVAPGYRIEQVAAEPLLNSPVAASFDEDGRLYVVEMRDYSEQDKEKLGRVRLLTDTDGDGRFDKSEIFAQELSWPTAIICYDGGVFVGAAPDIFYLKDTDGDGVADVRRVVFTGFGRGNVQGLLNSFCWGLDNRIHVAVSSSGANLQRVDDQGKPTGAPLSLRGRDFAFDPRDPDKFVATSGGGQHGMCFDDWGRRFVCSNSDHIQLIMLEDADLSRNPFFVAPNPRISIAVDGPQADVFRISPIEPWREVRTRLRVKGIVPGVIEGGGRAAGYFTSATGVTIYRGNAWPKQDRGLAIMGDVGGNLIHRKRLEPNGVELKARRIDEKSEFIASRDTWFRPVQFLNAPDGALYVLDMYRETIEHPASLPPIIKKHLDLTSGRDRGRIYRIVPEGFQQPKPPQLGEATTDELVTLLQHDNGWHRDTAARLLYQRQDPAVVPALTRIVRESKSSLGRLHALHTLAGLQSLARDAVENALGDPDARVRAAAVDLAAPFAKESQPIAERLLALVEDGNAWVRFRVALAATNIDDQQREAIVARLLQKDANDRWLRTAAQLNLREGLPRVLTSLIEDEQYRRQATALPVLRDLFVQLARNRAQSTAVGAVFGKLVETDPALARQLLQALPPDLARQHRGSIAANAAAQKFMEQLQASAVADARNADHAIAERVAAIGLLQWFPQSDSASLLELLEPSTPSEVQVAALRTIEAILPPAALPTSEILSRWNTLGPRTREAALEILNRHAKHKVREAILQGTVAITDLPPALKQSFSADREIAQKFAAEFKARDELLESYKPALSLAGDATRGAELFKKQCSSCHKLGGVGHELGPNLAAMKNRGAGAILANVLDPNREVNPQFVTYAVVTKDGRALSGMIAAETANSITLQRADNQQDTVLRIDIEELRSTGLSLMPEGLEKQLDRQQLADVIEFILKQ